jgi:hypothetical protein
MPSSETLATIGKFVIAAGVIAICGYIIATTTDASNLTQAWSAIFLIVGWIIRDSSGQSATSNAVKTIAATTAASSPTITVDHQGGNL